MAKEKVIYPGGGDFFSNFSSKSWTSIFLFFIIVVVALTILNPFVKINAGHRGVVLSFGAVSDTILTEGLHFRMPIVQSVIEMDVRVKKNETQANAASNDLQMITSNIALNYHLDPKNVHLLFKEVGESYERDIIDPAVQEVVKKVTAEYSASELITKRGDVSTNIKTSLEARVAKYHILVDDFSIKDFQFSKAFSDAIEAKQEAEQLAQKAENDLKRIKTEAEQKIATAGAEAEALRLKNISVSPLMIQLHAIEKWDGKLPQYMGSGSPMPFINVK